MGYSKLAINRFVVKPCLTFKWLRSKLVKLLFISVNILKVKKLLFRRTVKIKTHFSLGSRDCTMRMLKTLVFVHFNTQPQARVNILTLVFVHFSTQPWACVNIFLAKILFLSLKYI